MKRLKKNFILVSFLIDSYFLPVKCTLWLDLVKVNTTNHTLSRTTGNGMSSNWPDFPRSLNHCVGKLSSKVV